MTRLMGRPAPADLPLMQANFDEKQAREYFQSAINNGQARFLLAELNKLDGMLRELEMQETDECPIERIRGLMQSKS